MLSQEICEGVLCCLDLHTLSLSKRQHKHPSPSAACTSSVSLQAYRVLSGSVVQHPWSGY